MLVQGVPSQPALGEMVPTIAIYRAILPSAGTFQWLLNQTLHQSHRTFHRQSHRTPLQARRKFGPSSTADRTFIRHWTLAFLPPIIPSFHRVAQPQQSTHVAVGSHIHAYDYARVISMSTQVSHLIEVRFVYICQAGDGIVVSTFKNACVRFAPLCVNV